MPESSGVDDTGNQSNIKY